jgi:tRNA(fMet)-specific endonuclease VapC
VSAYLIDTDWIIQVLHGNSEATDTLEDLAPQGLAVSLIIYGELYQGAYYARDAARALELLQDVLDGIEILPLTEAIVERFAIVRGQHTRNQRQQIGDMDLLIAATALEHGLTLVTFTVRDYRMVPGLTPHLP